jgi:hypothetical protein
MLTKVSLPYKYATSNIINYIEKNQENQIEKIQDNMEGYLLIKLVDKKIIMYNYYLNKYYSHDKIKINLNENYIIKQIDSFDQNNFIVGKKVRTFVINQIKWINQYENQINSILGVGGEYYLYWKFLPHLTNLIGISNHQTIIDDAITNIPWSFNHIVDYNNLKTYPKIKQTDLVIINLSNIYTNLIKYLKKINFFQLIIISCDLPDSKLKLISDNFKIKKIKYFKNIDGLIRILILEKKELKKN